MPSVSAKILVSTPVNVVYRYLLERYDRPVHQAASLATKGYVPSVVCLEADEPHYLRFFVKGHDPLLRAFIGGWQWEYDLEAVTETDTEVTIRYRWSWLMTLLSAGTVRHQACNDLVETAMALDALGWNPLARQPLRESQQPRQSSEAIRENRRGIEGPV
jgi:hypothetical protein